MGNDTELEILLYDKVRTPDGIGVVSAIEYCYEGMPYTVAFPDGHSDDFEGCVIELIARPVYAPLRSAMVPGKKKLYLAYNDNDNAAA